MKLALCKQHVGDGMAKNTRMSRCSHDACMTALGQYRGQHDAGGLEAACRGWHGEHRLLQNVRTWVLLNVADLQLPGQQEACVLRTTCRGQCGQHYQWSLFARYLCDSFELQREGKPAAGPLQETC